MFNPLYPFTTDVLEATIKRGCTFFVRNTYPNAFDHFDENLKGHFIITHYDDSAKARAHYNSLGGDVHRYFYDWNDPEQQEKLKLAAKQPAGYKIYSTYFFPDYKKKITPLIKEKINKYMYRHTNWKPGKGETVHIDFFLQFGAIFISMRYDGQEIKVNFMDIENSR